MLLLLLACTSTPDDPHDSEGVEDTEPVPEDCAVEGDEDQDGLADCEDPDCEAEVACQPENLPPSEPAITIQPAEPTDNDALTCVVTEPGIDPEGETVIHQFAWLVNNEDAQLNTESVSAFKTTVGDVWECQARAWDGVNQSEVVRASVTIVAPE